jgi:uncharacterized protein DUF4129
MLAAAFANPIIERVPPVTLPLPTPQAQPTANPAPADAGTVKTALPAATDQPLTVPTWVTWVVSGLCLFAIAALLWILLRERLFERKARLRPEPAPAEGLVEIQAKVHAALEESLSDLDEADVDPRRAVIACWVRLEQLAAASGTPRAVGDTSTDLVGLLLRAHHVSASVLDDLAATYRTARFAAHDVGPAMRDQARAALRQLRDELAAKAT